MTWAEIVKQGYDQFMKRNEDLEYVVRCKDCKYHEDEVPGMVWCPHIVGNWVNNNWFCAEGKRKGTEDGQE